MPMMNQKPNFKKAYLCANEILVASSVLQTFPFSPTALVNEQSNIVCRTYGKAAKYGIDMKAFGSESATIFRYHDKCIIFYDEHKPKTHVTFSLLHEFGHERLEHDFARKDAESYHNYEVESNFFAAQLLMPEQLIRAMQSRGKNITCLFLQYAFGVSGQAATKRLETLAKTNAEWHSRSEQEFDDVILNRYADFLNKVCPTNLRDYYDFEDEYERQQVRNSWYG